LDAYAGTRENDNIEGRLQKLKELGEIAEKVLGDENGLTEQQVLERLGMNEVEYEKEIKGGFEVEAPDGRLKVLKRARHVVRLHCASPPIFVINSLPLTVCRDPTCVSIQAPVVDYFLHGRDHGTNHGSENGRLDERIPRIVSG